MTEKTLWPAASSIQEMKIQSLSFFDKIAGRLSLQAANSFISRCWLSVARQINMF
jgi:hypothetical protein